MLRSLLAESESVAKGEISWPGKRGVLYHSWAGGSDAELHLKALEGVPTES
jgi:hypothetical protein